MFNFINKYKKILFYGNFLYFSGVEWQSNNNETLDKSLDVSLEEKNTINNMSGELKWALANELNTIWNKIDQSPNEEQIKNMNWVEKTTAAINYLIKKVDNLNLSEIDWKKAFFDTLINSYNEGILNEISSFVLKEVSWNKLWMKDFRLYTANRDVWNDDLIYKLNHEIDNWKKYSIDEKKSIYSSIYDSWANNPHIIYKEIFWKSPWEEWLLT